MTNLTFGREAFQLYELFIYYSIKVIVLMNILCKTRFRFILVNEIEHYIILLIYTTIILCRRMDTLLYSQF